MLRKPWSGYLKQDILDELKDIVLIEEKRPREKFIMTLYIELNPTSNFYKFLSIGYSKENSRVSFFEIDNYPDCIILERTINGHFKFHIFELKKNPTNGDNLTSISQQFLGGYMHNKFIEPFLENNPSITTFDYLYHVVYTKDNNGHMPLSKRKKHIPGTPPLKKTVNDPSRVQRRLQLQQWSDNKIVYKSEAFGPEFDMEFDSINKIKLLKKPESTQNFEVFDHIICI